MPNNENIVDIANNYIYPSTLELYLEKGLLVEYLHALDGDSLESARDYIEMDDLTETRLLIMNLIKKEFIIRAYNIASRVYAQAKVYPMIPTHIGKFVRSEKRTLTIFLANHKLTEYLQTLTDEELEQAERNLYVDDLVGDALDILSAIRIEKEYRAQTKTEPNKKVVK